MHLVDQETTLKHFVWYKWRTFGSNSNNETGTEEKIINQNKKHPPKKKTNMLMVRWRRSMYMCYLFKLFIVMTWCVVFKYLRLMTIRTDLQVNLGKKCTIIIQNKRLKCKFNKCDVCSYSRNSGIVAPILLYRTWCTVICQSFWEVSTDFIVHICC
mgnify:CR=1 FL=1